MEQILLTPEEIVSIVKEHDGDLVQMWNTEVVEGTLRVDSCMNYVLKAQLKNVVEWGNEWCPDSPIKRWQCSQCWQALIKEVE